MIRSVLALRAKNGMSQAVEDFYRDRGIIERALRFPGCHGVTLLRSTDGGPDTHIVVADWDDPAAYQRWVDDPWRAETGAALADLLDTGTGPAAGRLYEPVAFAEEPT
ncbi:MAG TPA: antibiotic biosynthesis monooxygenase family protein [Pseudonocardiaceae bacterium]|jgi:heme-degrading monooxygenase HmoA|nr:antibiotic biosynthesis monooxygenase family protein [Pseudonocardiaceae bacterium]